MDLMFKGLELKCGLSSGLNQIILKQFVKFQTSLLKKALTSSLAAEQIPGLVWQPIKKCDWASVSSNSKLREAMQQIMQEWLLSFILQ